MDHKMLKKKVKQTGQNNENRQNKIVLFTILISLILTCLAFAIYSQHVSAESSTSGTNTSLAIWDDTDNGPPHKYTFNSNCNLDWKTQDYWNVHFFVNYTKIDTGEAINASEGNCKIRFDENNTGTDFTDWENMAYNDSSTLWESNRSFTRKGLLDWQVSCTTNATNYENLSIGDGNGVEIKNSEPCILGKGPGGNLATFPCDEDSVCYYNFSKNCSDDDLNDILEYKIDKINNDTPSNFPWFSINSSDGIIEINATQDPETGSFDLALIVGDTIIEETGTAQDTVTLPINITTLNDAPQFIELPENVTEDDTLNFTIFATDEENDTPFYFDFSVISCNKTYNPDGNCSIFNLTAINSTAVLFTFIDSINDSIATNDEVGNYTINFTVHDSGNTVQPYNASTFQTINFTVINTNDAPTFVYVCDNETDATENTLFSCWINATDVDESYNLTFSANYSWFEFNNSQNNITINIVNYSAQALVNFTPTDSAVGNWSINITVKDSGDGNESTVKSSSAEMPLNVDNIHDNVSLSAIGNQTAYPNLQFTLYVNASDDDLWIPSGGKQIYNESLTFDDDTGLFNITKYSESYDGSSNTAIARIQFTPDSGDVGNHTINISVTDETNNLDYKLFVLNVENNTLPEWNASTPILQNLTEDSSYWFNLSVWVTDADNDPITFYSNNSAAEFPSFSLDENTGILDFTPNDYDVGVHCLEIKAGDGKGNSSEIFTFNVSNIFDAPVINQTENATTTEDNLTTIYLYAYDDDLLVSDKSIYDENLSFTKNITNLTGAYRDLFNITVVNTTGNLTTALINFTPIKTDVGNYSINITVTDIEGNSSFMTFNLVILETNHAPQMNIDNQTAGVNNTFTLYVTATDADNDSITFSDNATFFNITKVNETHENDTTTATALINFTPNDGDVGVYDIEINASDGSLVNSSIVLFKIYDKPVIHDFFCPSPIHENDSTICFVNATQTLPEDLTYKWILDDVLKQNDTGSGQKSWTYITNFTDEGIRNLIVRILNPYFNISDSKLLMVTHANAPPEFSGEIQNVSIEGTSTTLELLNYFSDVDHDDINYNQTINFTWAQYDLNLTELGAPTISISVSNYTMTFSSSADAQEYVKITAIDSNNSDYNDSSNYFIIHMTRPTPATSKTSTKKVPMATSIQIITPNPFSMDALEEITVPITLYNDGVIVLTGIAISAATARTDVKLKLSKSALDVLGIGEKEKLDLIINANAIGVRDIEPMEIIITANVTDPSINESAKILVNLLEHNRELRIKAEQKKLFLEELIEGNKECLELSEVLKEVEKKFNQANYSAALDITEGAIQACKSIMETQGKRIFIPKRTEDYKWLTTLIIIAMALVVFILSFLTYYYQKRRKFERS